MIGQDFEQEVQMKCLLTVLFLILSTNLLAETSVLSYRDPVVLKRTAFTKDLPVNSRILYKPLNIDDKRMIAGEFERSKKNEAKKTYLDGLRSRLQGMKGLAIY